MLVVGGLIQFAMILWSQNTINQITRDTARWAVTQSAVPCDSPATRSAMAGRANTLADESPLINRTTWTGAGTCQVSPPRVWGLTGALSILYRG